MLRLYFLFLSFFLYSQLAGQHNVNIITPEIKSEFDGQQYQFFADLPTLVPLPGAPRPPFYEYFWEFGDGHFSTAQSPTHTYQTGSPKEVRLYVTNNYAQGKTRVGRMILSPRFDPSASIPDDELSGKLKIMNHQDPVPNDELTIVLRYLNSFAQAMNGHVLLFYNETESKYNQFEPTGQSRMYNGEIDLSSTTHTSQVSNLFTLFPLWFSDVQRSIQTYRNHKLWRFTNLDANEHHNLFQSFIPKQEIIADTNSMVSMTAYLIPENRAEGVEKVTIEMIIRQSHDPNKMGVRPRLASFRNIENKTFKYRVDFQNIGDGAATNVKIETDLPAGLDRSSLQIEEYAPDCPLCSETSASSCLDTMFIGNKLVFVFRNIGLAALKSTDIVRKKQSKGYIKFSLKPVDKIKKKSIKTRTTIYMDQNPPEITKPVKTKFKLGTSIGVRGGYAYIPDGSSGDHVFIDANITPYKARGVYPIFGLTTGKNTKQSGIELEEEITLYETFDNEPVTTCTTLYMNMNMNEGTTTPCYDQIINRTINYEQSFVIFDLIAGLRVDPSPWFTIGGGVQYTFQLLDRQEYVTEVIEDYTIYPGNNDFYLDPYFSTSDNDYDSTINSTRKLPAIFGEIGLGQVQEGFSLGTRYHYSLVDERPNYWQFFLQYRF